MKQNRMTSRATFSDYAARVREFIRRHSPGTPETEQLSPAESERQFNQLALGLFALQYAQNEPYRRWCEAQRISPGDISEWRRIPAAPTAAFKEVDLTSLPADARTAVFHSSGTTDQKPGRHFHDVESLAVYEASLWPWFKAHLLADEEAGASGQHHGLEFRLQAVRQSAEGVPGRDRLKAELRTGGDRWLFLTPSPALAPHSSLAHMFETVRREAGAPDSRFTGAVDAGQGWTLDLEAAVAGLRAAVATNRPVVVCGTAFNFVHLLDALAERDITFQLPARSRVLETGGYKGRSRSVPKAELHALISRRLGIPPGHIVCEYGMCELSSQAYDLKVQSSRFNVQSCPRVFQFPPWARVRMISPETGREVPEGETGLIRVWDLANLRSVLAVQTEDLGIRRGEGFELLGRATRAEPRGCSLMAL